MSNPWEYINNINSKSPNIMRDSENDQLSEKHYTPFMVNRAFSYHYDTVLVSNIVNCWRHVDNRPQYEFYKNTIKPKKRFSKWEKVETNNFINILMEKYQCNYNVAEQYSSILSDDQKQKIIKEYNKGGLT